MDPDLSKPDWPARPRHISLALQGGGAHGAFTWGVLDALLESGRLHVDSVSGTSAGAMNAVALAHGLLQGGPTGAREALDAFWTAVAASVPFDMATLSADGQRVALAPPVWLMLQWADLLSPEQLNPFDANPLRDVLQSQIDFEAIRRHSPVRLFIAATHALTGQLRLFREHELHVEAVLASACLPALHRPVSIDGHPHWDGGYAANPPVWPLVQHAPGRDVMLVLLSPLQHADLPVTAHDIRRRTVEMAFSAAFLREMRLLSTLRQQAQRRWIRWSRLERRLANTRFHVMEAPHALVSLGTGSKLAASMPIFQHLKTLGRAHAQDWLMRHGHALGRHDTVDLPTLFGTD